MLSSRLWGWGSLTLVLLLAACAAPPTPTPTPTPSPLSVPSPTPPSAPIAYPTPRALPAVPGSLCGQSGCFYFRRWECDGRCWAVYEHVSGLIELRIEERAFRRR